MNELLDYEVSITRSLTPRSRSTTRSPLPLRGLWHLALCAGRWTSWSQYEVSITRCVTPRSDPARWTRAVPPQPPPGVQAQRAMRRPAPTRRNPPHGVLEACSRDGVDDGCFRAKSGGRGGVWHRPGSHRARSHTRGGAGVRCAALSRRVTTRSPC